MLARGIRSYHRPDAIEEALSLAAQGVVPLAGGTRLLAAPRELPNVLDLPALGLATIAAEDGDLVLGRAVTLQDVIDSRHRLRRHRRPAARGLPRPLAFADDPRHGHLGRRGRARRADSEVAAALLALNAVFVVAHLQEPLESPALRFLRKPGEDLRAAAWCSRS